MSNQDRTDVKTVTVGFDDSPSSRSALSWALALWDTTTLVVNAFQSQYAERRPETIDRLLDERRTWLSQRAAVDFEAMAIEPIVAEGDPHDVLIETSRAHHADLVVVGRGDDSRSPGILHIGNVTEHLFHHSSLPCASIPTGATNSRGPAVIGVNDSDHSRTAISWLAVNAGAIATEIVAVHVPQPSLPGLVGADRQNLPQLLEDWIEPLRRCEVPVDVRFTDPSLDIAGQLVEFCVNHEYQLLVVGAKSVNQFLDVRSGGVAIWALHRAGSLPLLVVPEVRP